MSIARINARPAKLTRRAFVTGALGAGLMAAAGTHPVRHMREQCEQRDVAAVTQMKAEELLVNANGERFTSTLLTHDRVSPLSGASPRAGRMPCSTKRFTTPTSL